MEEYNHYSESLQKALKDLERKNESDLEDGWDRTAPNAQHNQGLDEQEGIRPSDIYPEFLPPEKGIAGNAENAELGGGGGSTGSALEINVDLLKDEDYLKLLRSLNKKQQEVFFHVLHQVKTHSQAFYLFITGGAGVGKSVVITALHQALLRYLNKGPENNPDDAKILLGAPTGIAAFLIKGSTLHSLFHIPANQGFSYKPLTSDTLNTFQCKFRHVKLIIIDEISMVGNKLFSYINRRLQQIMGNSQNFGGISVIAVGDLFQLKPVMDGWIFKNLTDGYGPMATNLWQEHFHMFQLDQLMRQQGDAVFAHLLNRLRQGTHTKDDIQLLKTRLISSDITSKSYPMQVTHIFTNNNMVKSHNSIVHLQSAESQRITIHAWDVVVGDVMSELKAKIKNAVSEDSSKTMGLIKTLSTAIGQRIEMCCNVDVDDGLVNGAPGQVMAVTADDNSRPSYIWVKFGHERVGQALRHTSGNLYRTGISSDWTPVSKIKRQFNVGQYKCAQVMREQFPLRAASAKTSHRCQGSTMDSAVIDLSGYSFCHSHYVAMSRVTNLESLFIRNLNEKSISVNKDVVQEMKRLVRERTIEMPLKLLYNDQNSSFKLIFQNIRSISKHILDIQSNQNYVATHLNIYVETKLIKDDADDRFSLPGYIFKRFDWPSAGKARPAYGIALHSRCPLVHSNHGSFDDKQGSALEYIILTIDTGIQNLTVVALYSSPKLKYQHLKRVLQESVLSKIKTDKVIIIGDFNIDLLKNHNHELLNTMQNYRQCISGPTTDYHSLLDHLYTNIDQEEIEVGVMESYFSDHKAVWATLQ